MLCGVSRLGDGNNFLGLRNFLLCPKGAGTLVAAGGTMDRGFVAETGVPSPITISFDGNFPAEGATVVIAIAGTPRKGIILFFFRLPSDWIECYKSS